VGKASCGKLIYKYLGNYRATVRHVIIQKLAIVYIVKLNKTEHFVVSYKELLTFTTHTWTPSCFQI